jgi:hypothetical protein
LLLDNPTQIGPRFAGLERIRALHDSDLTVLAVFELFLTQHAVSSIRLVDRKTGLSERVACRNLDESEWKD